MCGMEEACEWDVWDVWDGGKCEAEPGLIYEKSEWKFSKWPAWMMLRVGWNRKRKEQGGKVFVRLIARFKIIV